MRAAAKLLAHFVRERADVGAGRALDDEARDIVCDFCKAVFEEFDFDRLELDRLIFAREFIGRPAVNLFGGEHWGHLLKNADALAGEFFKKRPAKNGGRRVWTLRLSLGIVSVGSKSETEAGGVAFAAAGIKLDEASGLTKQKNQHASSERIESAEMSDLAETGKVADGIDNVMGSFALGLVDDQSAVEGCGLWFAGHFVSFKL